MNTLGIKPFNPAERLAGIAPADKEVMAKALREWYGRQGQDPLQSEGLVQQHLQELWR
jgi:hypothetical protein